MNNTPDDSSNDEYTLDPSQYKKSAYWELLLLFLVCFTIPIILVMSGLEVVIIVAVLLTLIFLIYSFEIRTLCVALFISLLAYVLLASLGISNDLAAGVSSGIFSFIAITSMAYK